ncbi:hypothetical protein COU37_05030 [Candidatus Micrarchaeota archaeon CG10_big_fil_rev_8_21_14_0_10_45_29]|nr:MAG: hypothetical protein COU37_05030 [Candidatus Micrarchaeota archaeon CG10_big_fil_rev_8_21_14_0_10_45_29]
MSKTNMKNVATNVANKTKTAAVATKNFIKDNYQALLFTGAMGVVGAFATGCKDNPAEPVRTVETVEIRDTTEIPVPTQYTKKALLELRDNNNNGAPIQAIATTDGVLFANGVKAKIVRVGRIVGGDYVTTLELTKGQDTLKAKLALNDSTNFQLSTGEDYTLENLNLGLGVPGVKTKVLVYGFEGQDTTGKQPAFGTFLNLGEINTFDYTKVVFPNKTNYKMKLEVGDALNGPNGTQAFIKGKSKTNMTYSAGDTINLNEELTGVLGDQVKEASVETNLVVKDANGNILFSTGDIVVASGKANTFEDVPSGETSGTITSTCKVVVNGAYVNSSGTPNAEPTEFVLDVTIYENKQADGTYGKVSNVVIGQTKQYANLGTSLGYDGLVLESLNSSEIINAIKQKKGGISN